MPLLIILRIVTFRSLSAPSFGYPRKSASIHSIALRPTRRYNSLPFGFPIPRSGTQSKNGKLHFTQPQSLDCIQSTPLLFPVQSAASPAVLSTPEDQKPQKPHRPLMVQVKINHSRTAFVLAAGWSHSFNRSILTSFYYFISITSPASAPLM